MTRYRWIVLAVALAAAPGCMVVHSEPTPAEPMRLIEPRTGRAYWLYVPSTYDSTRAWPLVVTLHGSSLWDSAKDQVTEWKHVAEAHGFIVAAPDLDSASFWRIRRGAWREDLAGDERAVLAVIDEVISAYTIAPVSPTPKPVPRSARRHILLTGFLEGGYPLYTIGLRNAGRFNMLIARDCYCDIGAIEEIPLSAEAKALPILIGNGKDGWWSISGCLCDLGDAWRAYRFLRKSGCLNAKRKEYRGGQIRRPERAYEVWSRHLPKGLRRRAPRR